ncbi:lipopolysaccharide heptosyltransferase II [Pasteurellaceae bacterium HPA106]|uniref:lipopolysaccharide heptosyltransferase II n=1 Tax=Spirabiliibacterium pneumoniae TaxID=221400 RepID=UPI001AACD707|nr:lipopolysaccharide heptosyltransferase II [Spirabiliibacterium pneumoniae]MBE2897227.1 lipopolysaccharide heptosyltransferase II [Spirabiliibacterium pneumoniae]
MNILIIGPSWVGDMMMSHSLYQQLKERYPDATIDVLAPNWCRALLSRMPEVRHALEMPIGHGRFALAERYRLGKALRGQYDMAIVLPNSLKSALVPFFARIAHRRGWIGESRYGLLNDWRKNKQDYPLMVQRYVALGFDKAQVPAATEMVIHKPYLRVEQSAVAQTLAKFARQIEQAQHRRVIGFCPGAEFGPAKRWPHYHYASLAEVLVTRGYQVQIFGSTKDEAVGEQIKTALSPESQRFCVNLAGQTTLPEVIDLMSVCDAVVSNDSGLMHIAAALGRPLVALYGPTSPEYTPPLSDNVEVIRLIDGGLIKVRSSKDNAQGYHQSLMDITPEMALDALERVIQK